jgi:hypothetical protein
MSLNVTLAPGVQFPNFPNPCEEVQKRAQEMGIQQDIRLYQSGDDGEASGGNSLRPEFATKNCKWLTVMAPSLFN